MPVACLKYRQKLPVVGKPSWRAVSLTVCLGCVSMMRFCLSGGAAFYCLSNKFSLLFVLIKYVYENVAVRKERRTFAVEITRCKMTLGALHRNNVRDTKIVALMFGGLDFIYTDRQTDRQTDIVLDTKKGRGAALPGPMRYGEGRSAALMRYTNNIFNTFYSLTIKTTKL